MAPDIKKLIKKSKIALSFIRLYPTQKLSLTDKAMQMFFISFLMINMYIFANSLFFHDIKHGEYVEAYKNIFLLIVCLLVLFKVITLIAFKRELQNIIRIMITDNNKVVSFNIRESNIIHEYMKKSVFVCNVWQILTIMVTVSSLSKPCFMMILHYYKHGDLSLILPFPIELPSYLGTSTTLSFCLLCASQCVIICFVACIFIGFEPLFSIFVLHACAHLEIARIRIPLLNEDTNDETNFLKMKDAIIQTQKVYRFTHYINPVFRVLLECYVIVGTFGLPLSLFQVIEDLNKRKINFDFLCFVAGSILHVLVPSYYCDHLMEKAEEFRQALYNNGWQNSKDIKMRKTLIFMLMRARKPPTLGRVFGVMDFQCFGNLCNNAYTILNFILAASRRN